MVCFSGGFKQTYSWVNKIQKRKLWNLLSPAPWVILHTEGLGVTKKKTAYKNREGGKSKGE